MTHFLLGSGPDHPDHHHHGGGERGDSEDGITSEHVWNKQIVLCVRVMSYVQAHICHFTWSVSHCTFFISQLVMLHVTTVM